jgi:hypothetical protein
MDYDDGEVYVNPHKRIGLISQIPKFPAGYTVENVLRSAFAPLTAAKRKMEQLEHAMAEGATDDQLREYDRLCAVFQAGGGYENGESHSSGGFGDFMGGGMGPGGGRPGGRSAESATTDTSGTSMKGLKADGGILISNGMLNIDSADDAIHSDDLFVINGGNVTIGNAGIITGLKVAGCSGCA